MTKTTRNEIYNFLVKNDKLTNFSELHLKSLKKFLIFGEKMTVHKLLKFLVTTAGTLV